MPIKSSTYGTVARLCEMYLSEYGAYKATSKSPHSERTAKIATEGLDSLLASMGKVIIPAVFTARLEESHET